MLLLIILDQLLRILLQHDPHLPILSVPQRMSQVNPE